MNHDSLKNNTVNHDKQTIKIKSNMPANIKALSQQVYVSPQLNIEEIDHLIKYGIKTIICNRPDEELSMSEPNHETMEDVLTDKGIAFIYQPISHITEQEITRFSDALNENQLPLLAYCTSGTRCTILWALSQVLIENQPKATVIKAAEKAGYSVSQYLG